MPESESEVPKKNRPVTKPLLIFDGDCGFCRFWVGRWQNVTGDKIDWIPFQEAEQDFPEITHKQFESSVQLIEPDGKVYFGAEAVFRLLSHDPRNTFWLALYKQMPGFAFASEQGYKLVARHRTFFSAVTNYLWGKPNCQYWLARWLYLRLLGLIYLIAFASFGSQVLGLVGSGGILPAQRLLQLITANVGSERFFLFPTLCWFNSSDSFLQLLCASGAAAGGLAALGILTGPALALCFILYLSLVTIGGDFLSFQWDILLLEVGFLSIFLAPWKLLEPPWKQFSAQPKLSAPSMLVVWLLRIVLFKVTFLSGLVKIASGDQTWLNLTALTYHWWTQPLPMPLAWYIDKLALPIQKAMAALMFFFELVVPFSIFCPRFIRNIGCALMIIFQLLIIATGNYTFFNWLTISLCVLLLDDEMLKGIVPDRVRKPVIQLANSAHNSPLRLFWLAPVSAFFIIVYGSRVLGAIVGLNAVTLPGFALLELSEPFHLVNTYGVFAVMTTERKEIIVEGSRDGKVWQDYEFKYKPGDPKRPLPVVEPFQPRLDWQMWFAALSTYERQPWFVNFMLRLLQGSPEVLKLVKYNPFPDAPPKYIRAVTYDYHFTSFKDKQLTGQWWQRQYSGLYFPTLSLEGLVKPE